MALQDSLLVSASLGPALFGSNITAASATVPSGTSVVNTGNLNRGVFCVSDFRRLTCCCYTTNVCFKIRLPNVKNEHDNDHENWTDAGNWTTCCRRFYWCHGGVNEGVSDLDDTSEEHVASVVAAREEGSMFDETCRSSRRFGIVATKLGSFPWFRRRPESFNKAIMCVTIMVRDLVSTLPCQLNLIFKLTYSTEGSLG
jgi:hypothetical protein